jgi:UDPglucose 6-dehydrogenase
VISYGPGVDSYVRALNQGGVRHITPVFTFGTRDAEAIKLFSNAYLAMRVAFFNELDTCVSAVGGDVASVIEGVCADPRIGDYYNIPSPGLGGKCLLKDLTQIIHETKGSPLFEGVLAADLRRKELFW